MSILSKIFGGGHNRSPADAANKYLNQIPGVAHQGYDPYIQQGKEADTALNGQYSSMTQDPQAFIDNLMKNYQTSEGYNFQKNALTKDLGNAAAAGGVAGTPLDQMNQGQAIQGLLSQDQQQYLQNALGVFGQGQAGQQGVSNRGYSATGSLTDTLGNALNQQGGLAFQGQTQKNSDRNAMIQSLIKALGVGAGGYFSGGGSLIGGGLGSDMFGGS